VETAEAGQRASGSTAPALTGAQVPLLTPVLAEEQDEHVPPHAELQQKPLAQNPLVQSDPSEHGCPCALVAVTQLPLAQVRPVLQAGVASLQQGWAAPPHAVQLVPTCSVGEAQQAPLAQPRGHAIWGPGAQAPPLHESSVQASLSALHVVPSATGAQAPVAALQAVQVPQADPMSCHAPLGLQSWGCAPVHRTAPAVHPPDGPDPESAAPEPELPPACSTAPASWPPPTEPPTPI
jgi:hypothetical protein